MQKTCSRCQASKNFENFARRKLSRDGRAAACKACINRDNWLTYLTDPSVAAASTARASRVKKQRFVDEPGYRRAYTLWGTTKKRGTKIPPWVSITDFVPICRRAEKKGPEYVLDHIIPIRHPLVCGLHVPANLRVVLRATNQKKGNTFDPDKFAS